MNRATSAGTNEGGFVSRASAARILKSPFRLDSGMLRKNSVADPFPVSNRLKESDSTWLNAEAGIKICGPGVVWSPLFADAPGLCANASTIRFVFIQPDATESFAKTDRFDARIVCVARLVAAKPVASRES